MVEGQPGPRSVVSGLGRAQEVLAPARRPFDRLAEPPRREQHQDPFRIKHVLGAEPATNVGGDEVDARLRPVEDAVGELPTHLVDALPGEDQRQRVLGRVVGPDGGPGLERRRHDPVVAERELHDRRRGRHGGVDGVAVPFPKPERQIAGRLVPDAWRPGAQSRFGVGHGRQVAELDRDGFGRILRGGLARRNHEGDRVANMPDAIRRERRPRRDHQGHVGRYVDVAGQIADALRREVGSREDRHDAGHG